MAKVLIIFMIGIFSKNAFSESNTHELLRRLTVFPIKIDNKYSDVAEKSWWRMRDSLTREKRFLVASRSFLKRKNAMQARKTLEPADAIILGRLLDAQGLVTTYIVNRAVKMQVYDTVSGKLLWMKTMVMSASVPIKKQLVPAITTLARDFVKSVPYQGFAVEDPLRPGLVYKGDNNENLILIEIGKNKRIKKDNIVQFIEVSFTDSKALFMGGANIKVIGRGRIEQVYSNGRALVQLQGEQFDKFRQGTLVEVAESVEKLSEVINTSIFEKKVNKREAQKRKQKPLVASLAFLGSIAIFLLLGF